MDPVWPVVRSWMMALTPLGVSPSDTVMLSPEFISRSLARSGVNVAVVDSTGFAGDSVRPFRLRNAKLSYSMPVLAAQVELRMVPLTGSSARLKMFMAAHHL